MSTSNTTSTYNLERSCPCLSDASNTSYASSSSCSASSLSPQSEILSPTGVVYSDNGSDQGHHHAHMTSIHSRLERHGYYTFYATPVNYTYPSPVESKADELLRHQRLARLQEIEKRKQDTRPLVKPASINNQSTATRPRPIPNTIQSASIIDLDSLSSVPMTRTKACKPIPRACVPQIPCPEKILESKATTAKADQYDQSEMYSYDVRYQWVLSDGKGKLDRSAEATH